MVSLLILILNIQIVHSPILDSFVPFCIFYHWPCVRTNIFQHDKRLWCAFIFLIHAHRRRWNIFSLESFKSRNFGILALPVAVTLLFTRKHSIAPNTTPLKFQPSWRFYFSLLGSYFFFLAALLVLIEHPIIEAVRSPSCLATPFLDTSSHCPVFIFFLFMASPKTYPTKAHPLSSCTRMHACFSLYWACSLLYPYGFGFDPFVHQATEKAIFDHGSSRQNPTTILGNTRWL